MEEFKEEIKQAFPDSLDATPEDATPEDATPEDSTPEVVYPIYEDTKEGLKATFIDEKGRERTRIVSKDKKIDRHG